MKIDTLHKYEQYGLQVSRKEYFWDKENIKFEVATDKKTLVLYFEGQIADGEITVSLPVVNEYFSQIPLPMIYNETQLEMYLNLLVEVQAYLRGNTVVLNSNVPLPDLSDCKSLYEITETLKGQLFVNCLTHDTFAQTLYNRNEDKYMHFYMDMDGYYHGSETNEDKLPVETQDWDYPSYVFKNGENFKPHHYMISIGEVHYEFLFSTTKGDTSSHFPVKLTRGSEILHIENIESLKSSLLSELHQLSETAKKLNLSWPAYNYICRWGKTLQQKFKTKESEEDNLPY